MGDHHDKKKMNGADKIEQSNYVSNSRLSLDSHIDDWPTRDHHFHNHHRHYLLGRKRDRADRENQRRRLPQYQSSESTTQEVSQEISDYEFGTSSLNSEATDVKHKLIQEYSHILRTIHEQNKYLERMKSRILSSWAQSDRHGLEEFVSDEQTKFNEDREKPTIPRSNYMLDQFQWPESPDGTRESCGYPEPESLDSARRSGGQEMETNSGANTAFMGSDLFSDGFGIDANEDPNFQRRGACCCSRMPQGPYRLAGGGLEPYASSSCSCPAHSVLIHSPNNCCCWKNFGYTKFSY